MAAKQRRESPDLTPDEERTIERAESGKAKIKTYKNIEEFLKRRRLTLVHMCN